MTQITEESRLCLPVKIDGNGPGVGISWCIGIISGKCFNARPCVECGGEPGALVVVAQSSLGGIVPRALASRFDLSVNTPIWSLAAHLTTS